MSSPIELRKYLASDLEDLHRFVVRAIRASYSPHYPHRAVEFFIQHHAIEKIAADGERAFVLVAFSGDKIVGTGTLFQDSITRVFVEPGLQRHGIGKLIMDALEQEAASHGSLRVVLDASLPSLHFYQELGYSLVSDGAFAVGGGQELRYYVLEKYLGAGVAHAQAGARI